MVRTFSLNDWILGRFGHGNQAVLDASLKRVSIESRLAGANIAGGLLTFVAFIVGAYMVLNGQTSLGVLMGLMQLNDAVLNLFYSLAGTLSRLQGALAAGDRILGVLDTPPEPERYGTALAGAAAATPEQGPVQAPVVAFDVARFAYSDGRPILQGLSFTVAEGQTAAFVGPSGGGKSTIFRLLMGHYPPAGGSIAVCGRPLRSYALLELRNLFAFVPQDAYLYSCSVRDNIRYGKPGAPDEAVSAAARAAYAHDLILGLPEGYDTQVGERGAHLSGGQRQRIAIARAPQRCADPAAG